MTLDQIIQFRMISIIVNMLLSERLSKTENPEKATIQMFDMLKTVLIDQVASDFAISNETRKQALEFFKIDTGDEYIKIVDIIERTTEAHKDAFLKEVR